MYYKGQLLKNTPIDTEPTFEIIKIFTTLASDEKQYRIKNINTGKVQVATEDFLYPHN